MLSTGVALKYISLARERIQEYWSGDADEFKYEALEFYMQVIEQSDDWNVMLRARERLDKLLGLDKGVAAMVERELRLYIEAPQHEVENRPDRVGSQSVLQDSQGRLQQDDFVLDPEAPNGDDLATPDSDRP